MNEYSYIIFVFIWGYTPRPPPLFGYESGDKERINQRE